MKKREIKDLHQDLRDAGAEDGEAGRLVSLATELRGYAQELSEPAAQPGKWRHAWLRQALTTVLAPALASLVGMLLGIWLIAAAQGSLPGTVTYPLKLTSERLAARVNPDYTENIMMRRAQEIAILVEQKAATSTLTDTLHGYSAAADAYKQHEPDKKTEDSAAFAYCERILQEAESKSSGKQKQAIGQTLAQLHRIES